MMIDLLQASWLSIPQWEANQVLAHIAIAAVTDFAFAGSW